MQVARRQRDDALRELRERGLLVRDAPRDFSGMLDEVGEYLAFLEDAWRQASPNADQIIQNELDSFQLATARQWRRAVSTTAIAVSAAIGLLLAQAFQPNVVLVTTLLAAVVGGYLSWVLRDITAGLERWRQRP